MFAYMVDMMSENNRASSMRGAMWFILLVVYGMWVFASYHSIVHPQVNAIPSCAPITDDMKWITAIVLGAKVGQKVIESAKKKPDDPPTNPPAG